MSVASKVDLLAATAALIDIGSVSHHETEIADHVEARLRAVAGLDVSRIANNVVARTSLGRRLRLGLVGHLDTVPVNGNDRARIDGDVLHGLGSADMKGSLAVSLHLAESLRPDDYGVDVTYVFYECEEVAAVHNGLKRLLAEAPELMAMDAAILGEPTETVIEAGCQGTMRLALTLRGARAHTARPWMGRNAIHRLALVLARIDAWEGRRPTLDGCHYREAMQAVRVEGGVAGNVVPDEVTVVINHRFAPDRDAAQAEAQVRAVIGEDVLADDAALAVVDVAAGAPPSLTHELFGELLERTGAPARAKMGWTDVAFFAGRGIPALNYGSGDPTIAHTAGEHVHRHELDRLHDVLRSLITAPR